MTYTPRTPDESMIRGFPRPVTESPFLPIERVIDDERALIQQEIEDLRRILNRSAQRRRRDD